MTQNFPDMILAIRRIREMQPIPSIRNIKKITPRPIIVNLFRICDKEKIFKAAREQRPKIRMMADFLTEMMQGRKLWINIFLKH